MAQILVRGLDDEVVEKLKRRAKNAGRSLEAEARMILREATQWDVQTARETIEAFQRGLKGRKFSDSTKIIREMRDSR